MRALILILSSVGASIVVLACDHAPPSASARAGCAVSGEHAANRAIMEGLRPHCEGCHKQGTRGYFASLSAFESLLVADGRLIRPGHPDDSELVRLLEGHGTGAFRWMPAGQRSYSELVDAGEATLTVPELRAWIAGLGAQERSRDPDPDAARVARVSASEVQRALYQQLGLDHDDFFSRATEFDIEMAEMRADDRYPVQPPDAIPGPRQTSPQERYFALGGGSVINQTKADRSLSPTFVQTLTQVSQAWCRLALEKADNRALFPAGAREDVDPEQVKATIRRWFRHFHGTLATSAEVDAAYRAVFIPLSQETDTRTAYVGLCSFFIRHPSWIFY